MRKKITLIATSLLCLAQLSYGQMMQVNEYLTTVKTTKGPVMGYLEQVTDSTVHLLNDQGEAVIPYQMINKIVIKNFRRSNIASVNARMASRKPAPNEEIRENNAGKVLAVGAAASTVAAVIASTTDDYSTYQAAQYSQVAISLLSLLMQNRFSNIERFRIYGNPNNYRKLQHRLESYSVQYQIQP